MNGQGRMMQGRGGRGMVAPPPHYLNVLNQYNTLRVLSYLSTEDRRPLGEAYPKFKIIQQQQEQQLERIKQMRDKQMQMRQGKLTNAPEDFVEECTAHLVQEETNKPAEGQEENLDEEAAKRREQAKKDNIANAGESVSDPQTLLARLNTKRLFRRIKLRRKEMKEFDANDAYTMNMTTEQVATHEWQELLATFKAEQIRKLELAKKKREGTDDDDDEEEEEKEQPKGPSPIPSSCELLLFSPCPRAVAVLASYPRSGNSLLRNLYERTTLRVTGSDMRGGLTKHDLVGEAATQTNCVQFVKTHFPERRGAPAFPVSRAVLLVRNPYDAMDSYFNLMTTNTHTTSLSDEERAKATEAFSEMAKKEILVWRDFHEYWLQQDIPLLVIRYEDLIRYTDKVIAKVIRFVLEINDMKFFESRIDRCIREEQIEKLGSYKPRSGGIGKSLSKYPPELLQTINTGIVSTMEKFGYTEMLVPDPSQWELEPMDQYGVFIPGSTQKPLMINGNNLVRNAQRHTDWRAVQRQLRSGDDKEGNNSCNCYRCVKGRFEK